MPYPPEDPNEAPATEEEPAPVRAVTVTEASAGEEEFSVLTEAPIPFSSTELT